MNVFLLEGLRLLFHFVKGEISVSNARRKRQATNDEMLDSINCRLGTVEGRLAAHRRKIAYGEAIPSFLNEDINLGGRSTAELFNQASLVDANWIVDGYMKAGHINFVVAGGGVGKSILITQISLAVALGKRPVFLPDSCSASVKNKVVYYRLENFADELTGKYGDGKALLDAGIKWFLLSDLPTSNLDGFIKHLEALAVELTEDTLVCVDPATKLSGYKHDSFVTGVEHAMALARDKDITMSLVVSIHHNEIKDWNPLSIGDIKGGDKAFQLAGSVIAIRKERTGDDYRFLQCLKDPKGSPSPYDGKVLVCKVVNECSDSTDKYLHYEYEGLKLERDARPTKAGALPAEEFAVTTAAKRKPNQKIGVEEKAIIHKMHDEGIAIPAIARELKVCEKTIKRHLKIMEEEHRQ